MLYYGYVILGSDLMYHYSSGTADQKLKKRLLIIALIGIVPFVTIVLFGFWGWEEVTVIDYQISQYFYNLHSPIRNTIMTVITHMGDLLVQTTVTVLTVLLLFALKKWRTGLWYGLTVLIGAGILNGAIKEFYGRVRPSQIEPLVEIGGYSFPSGHSMGSIIVYGGILFLILQALRSEKLKVFFSLLVFLMILGIGFSRIYLGVHFPTDVIGGFSLGFSWIFLSISLFGLKYTSQEFKSRNRYSISRF